MYGLPRDVCLTFLHGRTLLQACFGANDLILNFDGEVSVTVTSSVGYSDRGGTHRRCAELTAAAKDIVALLNRTVLTAAGHETGSLELKFDTGEILTIYDDSAEYESYVINNGGHMIVV